MSNRPRIRDRSTGDLLVLMIAGTICGGLIATGIVTTIFVFLNPGFDVTGPARFVADIVNTLIGLLAGFLAGRTDAAQSALKEAKEAKKDETP